MFGYRSDGVKIKNIEPFLKIVPHIMNKRCDSQNLFKAEVACETMDEFIDNCRLEKGISFSYLHIIVAGMVRLLAMRPQLNRFVMNGRIYARHKIYVSFVVKKALKDDAIGTTVKLEFDGTESIYEVKELVDAAIKANSNRNANNETDDTAKMLTHFPNALIKLGVFFVKWFDKHGMLSKKIIHASPFHTSCFVTNMKSIKTDYIYHHLYDFGTTGIFIGMGKESYQPIVLADKTLGVGKRMSLGVVTDERFCDGLYYANSLRMMQGYFMDPTILEKRLEHKEEDIQ